MLQPRAQRGAAPPTFDQAPKATTPTAQEPVKVTLHDCLACSGVCVCVYVHAHSDQIRTCDCMHALAWVVVGGGQHGAFRAAWGEWPPHTVLHSSAQAQQPLTAPPSPPSPSFLTPGCITSAEAVLLSSQSAGELAAKLQDPSVKVVVTVSPQSRAALAGARDCV